jgi:hypothetical protein
MVALHLNIEVMMLITTMMVEMIMAVADVGVAVAEVLNEVLEFIISFLRLI